MGILLEACVDSVEAAVAAQEGGVQRVELCANLLEGGTTPSAGTIELTRRRLTIGVNVMIRPRGGDFCYSPAEFEVMKLDVEVAKRAGADGIVIGILTEDGSVDRARTAELVQLARPMTVTFHRAFDVLRDPYEAMEALIDLGVDRILTSGQESSVLEGIDLIADLVRKADGRIIIMPGAGITERNIQRIVDLSGAQEFHVVGAACTDSRMAYRSTRVFMGGELRPPEYSRMTTDAGCIAALVQAARRRE